MSLLLIGAEGELGAAVAGRLLAAGDEVRAVVHDDISAAEWRELGVHVARGDGADEDLIERAAQNVRTIVCFGRAHDLGPILDGARPAGVDRIVLCGPNPHASKVALLRASGLDYVVLGTGGRRSPSLEQIALAIDAADDLAGHPQLELDLTKPAAWAELRLAPPGAGPRGGVQPSS